MRIDEVTGSALGWIITAKTWEIIISAGITALILIVAGIVGLMCWLSDKNDERKEYKKKKKEEKEKETKEKENEKLN